MLRLGEGSERTEDLPAGDRTVRFIALRFPMRSDDGVVVAVCTKLVDLTRLQDIDGQPAGL